VITPARTPKGKCATCGGTGRIWSMRSWFTYDGYYSSVCGLCGGSGASKHRTGSWEGFQRQARERIAADLRWASHEGANTLGREADVWGYTPGDTYREWSERQRLKAQAEKATA